MMDDEMAEIGKAGRTIKPLQTPSGATRRFVLASTTLPEVKAARAVKAAFLQLAEQKALSSKELLSEIKQNLSENARKRYDVWNPKIAEMAKSLKLDERHKSIADDLIKFIQEETPRVIEGKKIVFELEDTFRLIQEKYGKDFLALKKFGAYDFKYIEGYISDYKNWLDGLSKGIKETVNYWSVNSDEPVPESLRKQDPLPSPLYKIAEQVEPVAEEALKLLRKTVKAAI